MSRKQTTHPKTLVAWPRTDDNPYLDILYNALEASGLKVIDSGSEKWRGAFSKIQVVHFHWLNDLLKKDLLTSFSRSTAFLLYLALLRLRRVRIVWTIHNMAPYHHDHRHPMIEKILVACLFSLASDLIIHRRGQVTELPELARKKTTWIPHHNYLEALTRPEASPVGQGQYALYFGKIHPRKGVDRLVEAFEAAKKRDGAIKELVVAGTLSKGHDVSRAAGKLREAASNLNGFRLVDRFLPDDELEELVRNAIVVVLPFETATNSGSLIYSLSMQKKVITRESDLVREIIEENPGLERGIFTFQHSGDLQALLENSEILNHDSYYHDAIKEFLDRTSIHALADRYLEVFGWRNTPPT